MLEQVAEWLSAARRAVVFTGAGISTESGIPDFRSPGGVWATNKPVYYDDFLRSAESRFEYWRQKSIAHQDFAKAKPNAGHRCVVKWEAAGLVAAVLTQNIDGLHQLAGSRTVLEVHGTAREVACVDCGSRHPADAFVEQFVREQQVPPCPDCAGRLKHATISFGQGLDQTVWEESVRRVSECDVCLAIGSSLVVEPAASLPQIARQKGAKLVIINRESTPLDYRAHATLRTPIGETLEAIDRLVGQVKSA